MKYEEKEDSFLVFQNLVTFEILTLAYMNKIKYSILLYKLNYDINLIY